MLLKRKACLQLKRASCWYHQERWGEAWVVSTGLPGWFQNPQSAIYWHQGQELIESPARPQPWKQPSRPRLAAWLEGEEYLVKEHSTVYWHLNKRASKDTEKPESNKLKSSLSEWKLNFWQNESHKLPQRLKSWWTRTLRGQRNSYFEGFQINWEEGLTWTKIFLFHHFLLDLSMPLPCLTI